MCCVVCGGGGGVCRLCVAVLLGLIACAHRQVSVKDGTSDAGIWLEFWFGFVVAEKSKYHVKRRQNC